MRGSSLVTSRSSLRGATRRGNLVKHPEIASSKLTVFPRNDIINTF
ncbi:hypothetical protein [Rickettsia hoogstraalii]|nr:hypothetical protein [Rickettsia hoogstraalii]